MRITFSWKDGGALLRQAFVMMLIATLVSADYPTIKPEAKDDGGGGGMSCSKCAVSEPNYRGPTWAYPCMKGYQGPKPEEIKCEGKSGCFRQLFVYGEKKVVGKGGCFDFAKKECVEKVTKAKFDEKTGCIPETAIEPPMLIDLRKECGIGEIQVPGGDATPAPEARRRKREAEEGIPKGRICVCEGDNCNNGATGLGRSVDSASPSINPISTVWTGVISGMSLIGGSLLVKKRV